MKHLLLIVALFIGVASWAQSVGTITMTLTGEGGSAIGMVTNGIVSSTEESGSFSSLVLDDYTLPEDVATALEVADIEDVAITVTAGKITIAAEGDYECNIYDIVGRLVAMQRATETVGFNVASGVYVVAVSRGGKIVCARKTLVK